MIIVESKTGKLNPKKTIFSELQPGVDLISSKLIKKGNVFYVEKYENAYVFLEGEKKFVGRGAFVLKSDYAGILWIYSEKIPVKVGVPKSSTPFEIGAYATVIATIVKLDAFVEFVLRKGFVSINKLRKDGFIKIKAEAILKEDMQSLLRSALFKIVEDEKMNRDYFRDKILETFEKESEHYDVLQYFTIDVADTGFSTYCTSIEKKIDEALREVMSE